ncbi:MAG TPA: twin-arginine translocation signal domain-containing protein, partial [Xanthobacteraceae bacterium]|nr:twin-arginine translocation signal domain-containing protein [Xanthobacteraceae bacterium]
MTSSINRREVLVLGGSAAALLAVAVFPFPAFAQSGGMKIGIVGSGRVGGTLGELWVKAGHQV